jgi:hypothetical protein
MCMRRLNAVLQGKEDRVAVAKAAFDAMGIDENSLPLMTEADFTKQGMPLAIARQLAVAIGAIQQ